MIINWKTKDSYTLTFSATVEGDKICVTGSAPEYDSKLSRRPPVWTSYDVKDFLKEKGIIVTGIIKHASLKNGKTAYWEMSIDIKSPALVKNQKKTTKKTTRTRTNKIVKKLQAKNEKSEEE